MYLQRYAGINIQLPERTDKYMNSNGYSRGLVDAAAKGNLSAVTALYNLSYEYVYRSLKVMIADESIIMDVAQDAYIRAFTNLINLADPVKFPELVRSLAVPDAKIMLLRKFPEILGDKEIESVDFQDDRGSAIPDSVIDSSETKELMEGILSGLNPEQRLITALFYYEKLSISDISAKIGISENYVKELINSSREIIKKEVDELVSKGANLYGMSATQLLRIIFKSFEIQPVKPPFKAATFETIRFGLGTQFFSQKPAAVKQEPVKEEPEKNDTAKKDSSTVTPLLEEKKEKQNNLQDVYSSTEAQPQETNPVYPVDFEDPDDYAIRKNKHRLRMIVVIFILLLSLAAGAAGALMLYQYKSEDEPVGVKDDVNLVSSQDESSAESSEAGGDIEITIPADTTSSDTAEESSKAEDEKAEESSEVSAAESSAESEESSQEESEVSEEPESSAEEGEDEATTEETSAVSSDLSLIKNSVSDYHRNDEEWVCFDFNDVSGPFTVSWFMNGFYSKAVRGVVQDGAIYCDFSDYAEGAGLTIYVQENTVVVVCNDKFGDAGIGDFNGTYTIS